jgi:5-oxoprolinase (ATP-hydrolysing)
LNQKKTKTNTRINWRFAIDRGGTFTDVIGFDPTGRLHATKLLSESDRYNDAALEGVRRMLDLAPESEISAKEVDSIRLGTTVATNALLERKGEPVALVITEGFSDLLAIGHQTRPKIFELVPEARPRFYERACEIAERIAADGSTVRPLDADQAEKNLRALHEEGIRAVAIVLAHAWKNPIHEQALAEIARRIGFTQVSVSSEVMPLIQMVGRGQTTLVDAYLSPVLRRYVRRVRQATGRIRLLFMQNAGGLTDAETFSGKDAVLSGPAGGVVGCAAVAEENGLDQVLGFDMGGTSTDVSRYDGHFDRTFETTIAGIGFQTPMLRVVTVAAGGGSLLGFDGQKLYVGPESAGANPGPACYGLGGPAALTDANLVLGRILPEHFPRTFGLDRDQPLQVQSAKTRLRELADQVFDATGKRMNVPELALGFVRIANEMMCRPIRQLTIDQGKDVREHALICFGGAAAQHACAIANTLGIQTVVIPPLGSLLSAYGIARADLIRTAAENLLEPLDAQAADSLEKRFDRLEAPLMRELSAQGVQPDAISSRRSLDLRPQGTDSFLNIEYRDLSSLRKDFAEQYRCHFGFVPANVPIEAVAARVEVTGRQRLVKGSETILAATPEPLPSVTTWFEEGPLETPVIRRESLQPGQKTQGPALIVEEHTTVVVEPGFSFQMNPDGHLILEMETRRMERVDSRRDPVTLEIFNHLFMGIAEQMGVTLISTAHSTNIRERLDFSCAIFDGQGRLIANAPHIPVHLGAMGDTVCALIDDKRRQLQPGDVYATNNPFRGGSHLPDVTVVTPVFGDDGAIRFFAASRGHHADIGGIAPGSLPPDATSLEQEGVVLDNFLLVREGRFDEPGILDALSAGPYPARNLPERLSDLRAQVAANQWGGKELGALVEKYTLPTVQAYMGHIQDNAAEAMQQALGEFVTDEPVFDSVFEDRLDDGHRICVRFRIERLVQRGEVSATIDFTGTDPQVPGNLNAPLPVTRAAALYVLRTLIERDIPLNEGCLRPITLVVPEGCLLNPHPGAAVSGGNVETSQRVVDVLYGALGVVAASQGTMNNLLFGRADGSGRQYYETIGGGAGAASGKPGAHGVQVHMTNTRITDVEVLEQRYPEVRVERFSYRRGSGGKGKYLGGDGLVRRIRFLEPTQVTILSERRIFAPYGVAGGKSGAKGVNAKVDSNGARIELPGKVTFLVEAGESVEIKTPGGGGFEPEE